MQKKKKLLVVLIIVILILGALTAGCFYLRTVWEDAIEEEDDEERWDEDEEDVPESEESAEEITEKPEIEEVVEPVEESTEEVVEEPAVMYEIAFDTLGGDELQPIQVEENALPESLPLATKEGCVFLGWYLDSWQETPYLPVNGVTENLTLYAAWYEGSEVELALQNALDNLEIGYTKKADSTQSVTGDVILPTVLSFGDPYGDVALQWSSNKQEFVTPEGEVTRSAKRDEWVTLTVQATLEEITCSREINLFVVHAHNTDISNIADLTFADIRRMNSDKTVTLTNENRSMSLNAKYSEIKVENSDDAKDTLHNIRSILGIENVYEELEASQIIGTEFGDYYRFEHFYNGSRVYGRTITVSTDNDNYTDGFNAGTFTTEMLRNADLQVAVSMEDAETIALAQLGEGLSIIAGATEQIIYTFNEYYDAPATAYLIKATDGYIGPDVATHEVIVSARDGAVISMQENSSGAITEKAYKYGSAVGENGKLETFPVSSAYGGLGYWMYNAPRHIVVKERLMDILNMPFSQDIISYRLNEWDPTAVSAYANMIRVVNWYDKYFGVVSFSESNRDIIVLLNAKGDGALVANEYIYIGSLDEALSNPYKKGTAAIAVDCLGHEYTHAYVQNLGGAPYGYTYVEVGTINEGYADFIGCLVDDDDGYRWGMFEDWLQGDWLKSNNRNVADPWSTKNPKTKGDIYYKEPADVGNLSAGHHNATIISHSFYQMLQSGISEEVLAKIIYQSIVCGYDGASHYDTFYNNVVKAATKVKAAGVDVSDEDIETIKTIMNISLNRGELVKVTFADENGNPFSVVETNFDYIDWMVKSVENRYCQFGNTAFTTAIDIADLPCGRYQFEAVIKGGLGTPGVYEGIYVTEEFEVDWSVDFMQVIATKIGEPDESYQSEVVRLSELRETDSKVADMLELLRQEIGYGNTTEELGNAVIAILEKSKELYFVTATDNSSMFGFGDISEKARYTDLGMDYYTNIINRYNSKGGFNHYVNVYMGHHIGPADRRLKEIGENLNMTATTGQLLTEQTLTDNQKKALIMAGELLEYFYNNRGNMEKVFALYEKQTIGTDKDVENFKKLTGYEDRMKELTLYKEMIVEVPNWITILKNSGSY